MTPELIDVCICTFRRTSIATAIESVAKQSLPAGVSVRIIVADNDVEPSGRETVLEAAERHAVDVRYVHAPAKNISIARNACIETSDTAWFAFLDDDEEAAHDWLAQLLNARDDVDVVIGEAMALYSEAAPRWMVHGSYHSNRKLRGESIVTAAHTGNVLIRRDFIEKVGLRFDPALGSVGGEDTVLFHELGLHGARMRYAEQSKVFEQVTPERENLGWILRRWYRSGQTHAHLTRRFHADRSPTVAALACAKTLYCASAAVLCAPFPTMAFSNLIRATFHLGVVAYSLRKRFVLEYR